MLGPYPENPLLLWGCPLHFRVYPGTFPQWHPYLPWHELMKCLPCQGFRWHSVLTAQTFCLSPQPVSTTGIPRSSSTTSNRSRNKTRYRTKAVSSEVDESLFGGNKVTLTQPLQVSVIWRHLVLLRTKVALHPSPWYHSDDTGGF